MTKFKIAIPELPIDRSLLPEHIFEECELFEGDKSVRGDNDQLMKHIKEVDAVIFNSSNMIDEDLMKQAPKLKIAFKSGARPENVDYDYAKAHGVAIGWTPAANSQSVAEYTILLMLASLKRFVEGNRVFRQGGWRNDCDLGHDLSGRTVGLVGFGGIGQKVAKMLTAFDVKLMAYDPYTPDEVFEKYEVDRVSFEEILVQCDIVSIHCMLTDETRNMFNREAFQKMKEGAILINSARGGMIDEVALEEAIQSKKIFGAGLDVYAEEPPAEDHVFRNLVNLTGTPHIAARTQEASYRECAWAIEGALDYLKGREPQNVVIVAPKNN